MFGVHVRIYIYSVVGALISINAPSFDTDTTTTHETCTMSIKLQPPSFKMYAECAKRELSYANAATATYVYERRKDLAEAGFFYTGKEDNTICFYCGGGLKDWEANDDPWELHAKWFSRCPFVYVNRGARYIDEMTGRSEVADKNPVKRRAAQKTDKEAVQCVVCCTYERDTVFLPCNHCCVCARCADALEHCAVCREPILDFREVYLS